MMGGRHLPEGYVETDRWTLKAASANELLLLVIVGLVAFFASLAAAVAILGAATGSGEATIGGGTFVVGVLAGTVLGVVLHEAVHGLVFMMFGGRPRFGLKPWTRFGPVFYAAAPGSYLGKWRYVAAGLGPAVLLTVALAIALALAAESGLLASVLMWAFVLNVAGSAGDMLMMRKVISYPGAARFEDTGEGFVVYGPAEGATVQS